ncbi:MAG TPA: thiol reductant ABC exporter subunit CydD [Streptosporangiaceae bacterium]|nr:thiol reductant ABC exporter subunit CydD [Streptosporangiaceae bacterium]
MTNGRARHRAVIGGRAAAGRTVTWRLLRAAQAARRYLIGTVLLGLAVTGLVLAQAGLLARALAGAAAGTGIASLAGTFGALLAVVLARAVAMQGGEVTALRAAAIVKHQLRSRLTRHALHLGPAWAGRQRAGELATLATSGLDSLDPYFARYLPQAILAVAVPAAVLGTVAWADWISGLIIAVTLPLIPLFGALVGLHTKARTSQNWQLLGRLSGHFLDVVQGVTTLKVFGRARSQERVITQVTEQYRASVMATLRIAFLSALVLELSAALATALVAVEVGLRLLYGQLGYATALLVLLLTPEAYLPLRNAAAQFHASADGTAAAARAFDILDTSDSVREHAAGVLPPAGPTAPDLRAQTITCDGIAIGYPGRAGLVLARVNLRIVPGERIVLNGPNGAGKTSVLSLLLRFVEPVSGHLAADGVDLRSVPADLWRSQIGWLPQHPSLFPWSVAQNIAMGARRVTRPAVEWAAAMAGAAEFIAGLPQEYDTVLDERAMRLSAGQRQKIALARLFLRDAPLILLDEPTAHLDPASAAEVDLAIDTLMTGRTVVLVTHRPGADPRADRQLAVEDGTITERSPDVAPI